MSSFRKTLIEAYTTNRLSICGLLFVIDDNDDHTSILHGYRHTCTGLKDLGVTTHEFDLLRSRNVIGHVAIGSATLSSTKTEVDPMLGC